jgi:hypothetical protein
MIVAMIEIAGRHGAWKASGLPDVFPANDRLPGIPQNLPEWKTLQNQAVPSRVAAIPLIAASPSHP